MKRFDERFATRRVQREKRVRSSRAQKMPTTKTTVVRANGAFNDENNNKRARRASKPKPKPSRQGDVTKKRCDQCLGLGNVPVITAPREASRSAIRLDSSPRRTPSSRFGFRSVGREKKDEKTRRPPKRKRKKEERKTKRRRMLSSGAVCARRMENSPAADVTVKASFCTDPRIGGERRAQVSESKQAPPFIER